MLKLKYFFEKIYLELEKEYNEEDKIILKKYIYQKLKEFRKDNNEKFMSLTNRDTKIIKLRYGIFNNDIEKTYDIIAKQYNLTKSRIQQIVVYSIEKIKHEIKDDIDEYLNQEKIKTRKKPTMNDKTKISELNLKRRCNNALCAYRIETIEELTCLEKKDIYKINRLGAKASDEIIEKVHEKGFLFKDEKIKNNEMKYIISLALDIDKEIEIKQAINNTSYFSIECLNISKRAIEALNKSNIHTIDELLRLTKKEVYKIRKLGETTKTQIIKNIHMMGLCFSDEEKIENEITEELREELILKVNEKNKILEEIRKLQLEILEKDKEIESILDTKKIRK